MKMIKWMLGIVMAGALVVGLAGCGKSEVKPNTPGGIDWVKFQATLNAAGPEAQQSAVKIKAAIRYGQYPVAIEELTKLTADDKLSAEQKKLVNDTLEQLKKLAVAPPAAPATK